MKALYTTRVTTSGGRNGHASSDDGSLDLELNVPAEIGGDGNGNPNPEQLFAAAYSASFGSALEQAAEDMDLELEDISVSTEVTLNKTEEDELELSVVIDAYIPGVDLETGEELVNAAHELCPYSRATSDNIDVTLNLLMDED